MTVMGTTSGSPVQAVDLLEVVGPGLVALALGHDPFAGQICSSVWTVSTTMDTCE